METIHDLLGIYDYIQAEKIDDFKNDMYILMHTATDLQTLSVLLQFLLDVGGEHPILVQYAWEKVRAACLPYRQKLEIANIALKYSKRNQEIFDYLSTIEFKEGELDE